MQQSLEKDEIKKASDDFKRLRKMTKDDAKRKRTIEVLSAISNKDEFTIRDMGSLDGGSNSAGQQ